MNKTAIKNYAVWARIQLIESAKQRAYEYEITENGEINPNLETIGGRLLSKIEKEQRQQLIAQIRQKGYTQVMEEAAYTWFNRFIALRFMEVNGYLPSKVRVFTDENNSFKPEILKEAMSIELEGLDRSLVLELLDKQDNEALFKYLLIIQCNALSAGLPYMFEKIANWTELLFPANLLRADSVISDIDVSDWNDEVEIIGWFYQYYISEKHDAVVDPLHGKVVAKEDIPAATQLFTTDWVVRYILDNSLGRYWIERHPDSKLAEKLTYFVTPKDGVIPTVNESISPEELKVLDPCVGSGHFLSYAFDILLEIYREYGWSDRDAAKSIIENNLYGLDIDDRAAQLACFAVMMKARKYSRRIISADTKLHILAMQDSVFMTDEFIKYVALRDASIRNDLKELHIIFNNAKEYGSIINVPQINYSALYARIQEIENAPIESLLDVQYQRSAVEELLPLIRQAEILSGKYDVVATNPPYMNKYSARLKDYIGEHYEDYKGDLFSVFVFRNFALCKDNGYSGFMTPNVWMSILSYEPLRDYILRYKDIITLTQMAHGAFNEIACVDVAAFVLNNKVTGIPGIYFKLSDFKGDMESQKEKVLYAIDHDDCGYKYYVNAHSLMLVPGSPITAFCASERLLRVYERSTLLSEIADPKQGIATSDNNKFLRLWFEVRSDNLFLNCENHEEALLSTAKWYPYNKGGNFRKWYGNNDFVVNWQHDGYELRNFKGAVLRNPNYYFRECISWSLISSYTIAFRYKPQGHLFDVAGMSCFSLPTSNVPLFYLLALSNSCLIGKIMMMLAPTINYQVGNIANIPVIVNNDYVEPVCQITARNIDLARIDWDLYETSWDFSTSPLVSKGAKLISEVFAEHRRNCVSRFMEMADNEKRLNELFLTIYDLHGEFTTDINRRDISSTSIFDSSDEIPEDIKESYYVKTKRDVITELISYAVGCIMGRYSLDKPGLAFAGGAWDASQYASYIPDRDGILPITDDEYFDDDIVGMFVNWVRTVYGEETLETNLKFIADALGGKGTPREVIRNYFLNDFYADHLKIYQKRPIYWLFSSGKKNGFKCLIYMHRYQPDLLARIRTDYVHEQQERYRTQLTMLEDSLQTAGASEHVKLNKQIAKIKDQALELQKYEEKIHHLADQMIPIDLDDGVKVNYAKFQDVLEKIK
jgi:hypothetical protein